MGWICGFINFGGFDFEEIEPVVVFGNINWLRIIYTEDFATIIAVKVTNDYFFVVVFPNKVIV